MPTRDPVLRREKRRRQYQRIKAAGVCFRCHEPKADDDEAVYCQKCAAIRRLALRSKRAYERELRMAQKAFEAARRQIELIKQGKLHVMDL